MRIEYIKYKGNEDKREKKIGHYLRFIRTWHVFSVSKNDKVKYFRNRKVISLMVKFY